MPFRSPVQLNRSNSVEKFVFSVNHSYYTHITHRLKFKFSVPKKYFNPPRVAMVVQQTKITCRTQVYRFCAHSLNQSIVMIKKSFKNNGKSQKCTKKMPIFHDLTEMTERGSMKSIYLCSTFNF